MAFFVGFFSFYLDAHCWGGVGVNNFLSVSLLYDLDFLFVFSFNGGYHHPPPEINALKCNCISPLFVLMFKIRSLEGRAPKIGILLFHSSGTITEHELLIGP